MYEIRLRDIIFREKDEKRKKHVRERGLKEKREESVSRSCVSSTCSLTRSAFFRFICRQWNCHPQIVHRDALIANGSQVEIINSISCGTGSVKID